MKILILARNKEGRYAPFIDEQATALEKAGVECQFYPIKDNGISGYLNHLPGLYRAIKTWKPDIIHAHYGICGLLANYQRKVPVVTTYHGSDINNPRVLKLSRIAIWLSSFNIFVSQKNVITANVFNRFSVIPCGVNLDDYPIIDKESARLCLGLFPDKKYVLFAGAYNNQVKNAPLAQSAISLLDDVELLELKGYTRQQVATLMQAVDVILMTSHTEGSPQVIKEALVCGCPIVSVDVGDVKEITDGVEGCFIADRTPQSVATFLQEALLFERRTSGRNRIIELGLTNDRIALKIIEVYKQSLSIFA